MIDLQIRTSVWIASVSSLVVDLAIAVDGSVGAISVGCYGHEAHSRE